MNEYNNDDAAFDNVIKGFNATPYQQNPAPAHTQGPYGIPANSIPVKPGLTKRGKVAIAIGTAVIATGGLVFWQHNNAVEAASQAKQQEYALENKKLDLEMLKTMNQTNAAAAKNQNSEEQQRQKQISDCVNTSKSLVGKQMGVTYSSVLKDCRDQFPTTADGSDMQTTASSKNAGSGVNDGILIGGAVLVGGILIAARRATHSNQA
ncbi:hypothetical protein ACL07V_37455 [Streptomyces sp. MB22_4]|uniref:hypothetical protein n=1 Tax=Streptomyces sp. MB22_4 TaxID=3383120 RepID=UPI0039A16AD9